MTRIVTTHCRYKRPLKKRTKAGKFDGEENDAHDHRAAGVGVARHVRPGV